MKISTKNNFSSTILICLFLVGCGGGSGGGSDDYSKLVCSNFGTQAAAQDAYNKGAKQLDSDNDGRACENLK